MGQYSEDYLDTFLGTLLFAFVKTLPINVFGIVLIMGLANMGTPYPILSVFSILILGYALFTLGRAINKLGSRYYREQYTDSLIRATLFQAGMVGSINMVFYMVTSFSYGTPLTPTLLNTGYALATPYWWFEIPFFSLWMALEMGGTPISSAMDSMLFLSAHKSLAGKLIGLLWLPAMLCGWFLPNNLVFPVYAFLFLWGPALILACYLHPGDSTGKPRKLEEEKRLKNISLKAAHSLREGDSR